MLTPHPDRVVREAERHKITGVPPSSWYPLQNQGIAPRPIPLGPRSVGWLLSELEAWVEAQTAKRDHPVVAVAPPVQPKRKRGRPAKAAQLGAAHELREDV
jgi:prophage regulatory protein